jgi:hypothetical protein
MAVHQCVGFSINPMSLHEQAVMRIGRYLLSTKDKDMKYTPASTKDIEVYVDADFAVGWDPGDRLNADNIYLELDSSFNVLATPFIGKANFKLRLLSPLLKPSILRYLKL